ncbi:hypothetical protein [Bordetella genomosp. 11]|uniref:hypothetical protein n=1 Tax=Bordetella genomosp. 11 TaxID=1416808 RepID=UPI001140215B|nr:hypothetical protein [Bordetella genomosp. 11]
MHQHTSWDIVNGVSNPLAYAYSLRDRARWHGAGLPFYAEVPARRAGRAARFSLTLRQPAPLLAAGDARGMLAAPRGRFSYAGLAEDDDMTVTSAAETYFARPTARGDGAAELATLFRPYWQARLAGLPERAAAYPYPGEPSATKAGHRSGAKVRHVE